ncbi:kynurenine--oxoglutarate transaminase 3-like isoform X4 [Leptotrombidium deliense]|uniref:kynurenine--oxoglutarate transaminase n=1 Tax=Leptotrombidium deliense TaxID=299467 RepID=A0A443S8F2_9ACAR|nr:kynurenine--oxoglutarate transaminase 3-like isoform X4 [Leptotrombidium deliense]
MAITKFNEIAVKNNAINLALGFPDYVVHDVVTKALSNATLDSVINNQYTRGAGHPRLIKILSKIYSNLTNHWINPLTDIVITVGGYEAIFCGISSHVNTADEVIIIEPFFESSIRGSDWILDPKELRSKFSIKTKMIISNTPNNPIGKIYTYDELQMIAKLSIEFNTLVLVDEVYEWMIFDHNQHIRMSKARLLTPLQEAFAVGYEMEYERLNQNLSFRKQFARSLQDKRDLIVNMFSEVNTNAVIPEGGFFLIVDFSNIAKRVNLLQKKENQTTGNS